MSRPPRPGIGHNLGPSLQSSSWQAYCWRRSRKALLGERMPIEIVRRRIARAREIGLTYPQYASILLGSGRDIVGFLFTVNGLQLRLARRLEAPDHVSAKLMTAPDAPRIALAPPEEEAAEFLVELSEVTTARIDAAFPAPAPQASWGAARRVVQRALAEASMPPDGVVMIGEGAEDARWADAAFLAKFIPTTDYFAERN